MRHTPGGYDLPRAEVLEVLAHHRRRATLAFLTDVPSASPAEIASRLLTVENDQRPASVTQRAVQRVVVELRHVHLPMMADAGLVTRSDGVVSTTADPVFEGPTFAGFLSVEGREWDDVVASLADEHRRVVLRVLHRSESPMDRRELASAVVDWKSGDDPSGPHSGGDHGPPVDELVRDLHHVHLPALEGAGLLEYDPDEGTVVYLGHPDLSEMWLSRGNDPERSASAPVDESHSTESERYREDRGNDFDATMDSPGELPGTVDDVDGHFSDVCLSRVRDVLAHDVDVYWAPGTTTRCSTPREDPRSDGA